MHLKEGRGTLRGPIPSDLVLVLHLWTVTDDQRKSAEVSFPVLLLISCQEHTRLRERENGNIDNLPHKKICIFDFYK